MVQVQRYGRLQQTFSPALGVERVVFFAPDGTQEERPTFLHRPAELSYDIHGYETLTAMGEPVTAVRFTPTQVGEYRYQTRTTAGEIKEGIFRSEPSAHPGYVEISRHDPRYFAYSNGECYCAIGLNLVGPPNYQLPQWTGHFATSHETATLGAAEYRRWFRELARNGGNFARLWLSNPYFETQGEVAGETDPLAFAHLDAVVELAREYGIRLKLCLEHFRTLAPVKGFFSKTLRHPQDGRSPRDMDEWFQYESWRELWLQRVRAYIARYGDDPVVMAWELWNEIECCATSDWVVQRDWTRDMLREVKRLSPRNLVVNSLGSFDVEEKQREYDDFHMPEMDFQQVHRYLDQGAPLVICGKDPVAFSLDAVTRARRPDRPVLLAETGAVNDAHTGPFRYYRADHRGIIFHDTTYPAFFAGAAGSGNIWHWDCYVEPKNLWHLFRPLANLVDRVALDREAFTSFDLSTDKAWIIGLRGKQHILLLVRNKADRWDIVLRDEQEPAPLPAQTIDISSLGVARGAVELFFPWPEDAGMGSLANGLLELPALRYSALARIQLSHEQEDSL